MNRLKSGSKYTVKEWIAPLISQHTYENQSYQETIRRVQDKYYYYNSVTLEITKEKEGLDINLLPSIYFE
jgi:hypothetical protein